MLAHIGGIPVEEGVLALAPLATVLLAACLAFGRSLTSRGRETGR